MSEQFTTTEYDRLRQEKAERLRDRADKARHESESSYGTFNRIHSFIPMGQPILVGHYSEKRHRRDLERADNAMRKSIDLDKKASHLDQRADSLESENGPISSRDPNALEKLQEKLAAEESRRDYMVKVNKAWRAGKLPELGFTPEQITAINERIEKAYSWEKQPYVKWELSNLGANIRRIKERIEQLSRLETSRPTEERETETGIRVVYNTDPVRIELYFPGKPDVEVRTKLKSNGFRWAPSITAWVGGDTHYRRQFVSELFA